MQFHNPIDMEAIVKRPYYHFENPNRVNKEKEGRGFSLGEISKAGLTKSEIRILNVRVDIRRKSVYDSNVEALKKLKNEKKDMLEEAKRKKMEENKKKAEKRKNKSNKSVKHSDNSKSSETKA
ncbi:ribosomal protein L13e [Sulfuracidifex metallicus]|uniref:50S ribosomal protein L13e n=2 Tax=Sulfuracidifex metallicus TaxID=47303 RepID=A0A6A9QLJ8_SULME|nr:ribosomal protein L13e [Sulfuracidifex metallicus]MUN29170.1 hypothetical protein [Sulfuracidifex metallicus DSM 6482 = JCM 9184]WOE50309.1 ribosomal protein L13e [Sulfuracidifex metallicus DSM 6482 = JCM 9184]